MGKSAEAPQSPDPNVTIPLQAKYNDLSFGKQVDAMRTNTSGPQGTQTWSQTPTFDEAGYNKALESWNTSHPGSTPGASPTSGGRMQFPFFNGGDGYGSRPGDLAGTRVYGEGGIGGGEYDSLMAPSRDQFTSKNWTLNTTLSPEQQQLYDMTTKSQVGQASLLDALTQRVGKATENPMDFSSFQLDNSRLEPGQFNRDAADAVYREGTRYLDPQMAQDQSAMESRLADQGFTPGTPGYAQAMQTFLDTKDRAYGSARDSATTQGFNVGNQTFNQGLAGQQQFNSNIQQMIANALMQRNQPLSELNAMRTGQQPQMPTGPVNSPTPNLSPVDAMGAINNKYMGDLSAYNADISSQNALFSGLAGMAGMFLGNPALGSILTGLGRKA